MNYQQLTRVGIFFIYLVGLAYVSWLATGWWIPPFNTRGLWFYSGLAALLLGKLIEAPYHSRPADSFAFSFVGVIAVLNSGRVQHTRVDDGAFFITLTLLLLLFGIALVAMLFKDSHSPQRLRASETAYLISSRLGTPIAVFSLVFLYCVVVFHRANAHEVLILLIGWSLIVAAHPLETALILSRKINTLWSTSSGIEDLGDVVAHEVPGIVLLRHSGSARVRTGDVLLVPGEDGKTNLALALGYIGVGEGLWYRALQLDTPAELREELTALRPSGSSSALIRNKSLLERLRIEGVPALLRNDSLIGIVAPGTDLCDLRLEVLRSDIELSEGRLLEVVIHGKSVLYQLLNGLTREETVHQRNTRGYVEAVARKIGAWNSEMQAFDASEWLPSPNESVFLAAQTAGELPMDAIGRFPQTSYPVRVDASDLVTHNTAILGLLGIGKTYLALELVERMLRAGIRVICLDLTDQYRTALSPYYLARSHSRIEARLQAIGASGKSSVQQNVEDGGSINEFRSAVKEAAGRFLDPKKPYRLFVVNPSRFEVWRQDSKPYSGKASMASLTAAEITRVFSEAALKALQSQGMTDQARCCLVYEEAHTLVPEWNAVAYEGDKSATNGTARAILQGRKFGLGCLLVTQRTASVTKTILNQCNTIFAMRSYDATGIEFLSNVVGRDYAGILSTLPNRHAIVFGKASSCSDPVLTRLNDRNEFLAAFRTATD